MEIDDYLISVDDIEWNELFSEWTWLIPPGTQIQPWMMNSFGDLFWFDEQERVNFLNISDGTNEVVADTQEEFFNLLEDEENLIEWLLIDLVDQVRAEGLKLEHGLCYGFKLLPTLEGEFGKVLSELPNVSRLVSFQQIAKIADWNLVHLQLQ
jgi:hypothetical protein